MKKIKFKIDVNKLVQNREGKVHGEAVTRGTGEHTPKEYKKKNINRWKKEVKEYID